MSTKKRPIPVVVDSPSPIDNTNEVLTALEPLSKEARRQVLLATIAFYGLTVADGDLRV